MGKNIVLALISNRMLSNPTNPMRYFCFCFTLCLLLITSACRQDAASSTSTEPAAAPEETASETLMPAGDDFTYVPGERFSKLSGTTQEGDLKFLYGERIVPVEIPLGEGFMTAGYRLFPGTANEADIVFPDEDNGFEQLSIIVSRQDSKWRIPGKSLAIGTSLHDLKTLNGKPFKFLGYEWDYAGLVSSWEGGALEGIGATLSDPVMAAGEALPTEMMGDGDVSSDNPFLKGKQIYVKEITIGLKPPAFSEDGIPATTDFAIVPGHRFGAMPASLEPGDLELIYGVGNVEPIDFDLEGGVSVPGFRLFPGTKNEVEIGFPDEDEYLEDVMFRISKEGSDWHIAGTDIRVGDRLAEVRNTNQKSLMIYSHQMEGGGRVDSWEGGRLAGTGLKFETSTVGRSYKYDKFKNVSSDAVEVKKSDPKVSMITISLER